MKRKYRRLSEVQLESSAPFPPPLVAMDGGGQAYPVRLPHAAAVRVPAGLLRPSTVSRVARALGKTMRIEWVEAT